MYQSVVTAEMSAPGQTLDEETYVDNEEEWESEKSSKELSREEFLKAKYGHCANSAERRKARDNAILCKKVYKKERCKKEGLKKIVSREIKDSFVVE